MCDKLHNSVHVYKKILQISATKSFLIQQGPLQHFWELIKMNLLKTC